MSLSANARLPLSQLQSDFHKVMKRSVLLNEMSAGLQNDKPEIDRRQTLHSMNAHMQEAERSGQLHAAERIAYNIGQLAMESHGRSGVLSALADQIADYQTYSLKPYAAFYDILSTHHEDLENILLMVWDNPQMLHHMKLPADDMKRLHELFQTVLNSRNINPNALGFTPEAKATFQMLHNCTPLVTKLSNALDSVSGVQFGDGFSIIIF
jgi:hypothetical protein